MAVISARFDHAGREQPSSILFAHPLQAFRQRAQLLSLQDQRLFSPLRFRDVAVDHQHTGRLVALGPMQCQRLDITMRLPSSAVHDEIASQCPTSLSSSLISLLVAETLCAAGPGI